MRAPKFKGGTSASASSKPAPTSMAWPPLPGPEQRSHALEIEEVLESQILLIHGFFPTKACTAWTNFLADPKNVALTATPPAQRGEAQRTNHRFSIMDEGFATVLWEQTGLRDLVLQQEHAETFKSSETVSARPSGLNPNIRVSSMRCPRCPLSPYPAPGRPKIFVRTAYLTLE